MSLRAFVTIAVFFALMSAVHAIESPESSVSVTGNGLVLVEPDQVVLTLTLTTTDDDLIRVRKSSDEEARTVQTLATKQGIDGEGFKVSRLDLSLDFNRQLNRQIYEVERDVTLVLNDLAKLDALLNDLLAQRNLKINSISFVTSKAKEHEFEARRLAVSNAKEKATHLAELNDLTLGMAIDINIYDESADAFVTSIIPTVGANEGNSNDPFGKSRDARNKPISNSNVQYIAHQEDERGAQAGKKLFALGKIEITATVEIEFELLK